MHRENFNCALLAPEDGPCVELPILGTYFWHALLAAWKVGEFGSMPNWVIDFWTPPGLLPPNSGKLVTPWERMHCVYRRSWSCALFDTPDEFDPLEDPEPVVAEVDELGVPPPHAARARANPATTATASALPRSKEWARRVGSGLLDDSVIFGSFRSGWYWSAPVLRGLGVAPR
jgi:hypothetical protein